MCEVRYATDSDIDFWVTLDKHIARDELLRKIRDRRGYIISDGGTPVGILRYNLFWDNTPFLTLLYLDEAYRGKGFGKYAMLYWENEMRSLGHALVMTSTQVDEQAQHFYRKLGYIDRGGISFDNTPSEQPMELIMLKIL